MIPPPEKERGAALLTVLLLVAVMAAVAATALDRVGLATRLTANARDSMQERAWMTSAELIALTRVEDLKAAQPNQLTLAGNWLGVARRIALPDGKGISATITDGGNCFNLNGLARVLNGAVVFPRTDGAAEFEALMIALGFDASRAASIAGAATDYVDSDDIPSRGGVERSGYAEGRVPANRPMADKSELRAVAGVRPEEYQRLERWICALPVIARSPVNINTLRPEEAPLLVMLTQGRIDVNRARAIIAARPPAGWSSTSQLFDSATFGDVAIPESAAAEAGVKSEFFVLKLEVGRPGAADLPSLERALIDARQKQARVISRQWGEFL